MLCGDPASFLGLRPWCLLNDAIFCHVPLCYFAPQVGGFQGGRDRVEWLVSSKGVPKVQDGCCPETGPWLCRRATSLPALRGASEIQADLHHLYSGGPSEFKARKTSESNAASPSPGSFCPKRVDMGGEQKHRILIPVTWDPDNRLFI